MTNLVRSLISCIVMTGGVSVTWEDIDCRIADTRWVICQTPVVECFLLQGNLAAFFCIKKDRDVDVLSTVDEEPSDILRSSNPVPGENEGDATSNPPQD